MPTSRCGHAGCTKRSSYGAPGSKKPEFCLHHAQKTMIDVVSKRCAHSGCNKWPSYGMPASKKAEFCANHARPGMVGVCNKRCAHPGCTKQPKYGVAGSKKREFCAPHAKGGMVDVYNKRCGFQGCTKGPSYGVAGSKKREFCAQHAKEGMVNVCSRKRARDLRDARLAVEAAASARPKLDLQQQAGGDSDVNGGVYSVADSSANYSRTFCGSGTGGRMGGDNGSGGGTPFQRQGPGGISFLSDTHPVAGGTGSFDRHLYSPMVTQTFAGSMIGQGTTAAAAAGGGALGGNMFEPQGGAGATTSSISSGDPHAGPGGALQGALAAATAIPPANSAEDAAVAELVMGLKNRRTQDGEGVDDGDDDAAEGAPDVAPANNERCCSYRCDIWDTWATYPWQTIAMTVRSPSTLPLARAPRETRPTDVRETSETMRRWSDQRNPKG
ncbi:unnamed protein product [Ectocarpus sp. 8 AP-2014]